LEVAYPLGIKGELKAGGKGRKSVAFSDNVIKVAISFTGEFVEKFPLILAPTDKIEVIGDSIMVTRSGHEAPLLTISRGKGGAEHRPITLVESSTPLPNRRLVVAQIPASKRLDYTMKF